MEVHRNDRAQFDLEEFLGRPLLAHVASFSDAGPRSSLFWYLWEDAALWMILEEGFNTLQERIRADPRVAVGFADFDPATGFLQHVSVRGPPRSSRGTTSARDASFAATTASFRTTGRRPPTWERRCEELTRCSSCGFIRSPCS